MVLERTFFRVEVSETDKDRSYWASRPGLSTDTIAAIRSSGILLIPWEGRGAEGAVSFPSGTTAFYRSLRAALVNEGLPSGLAIAVEQDQYQELSLHADEERWPSLLISAVLLPLAINLLSNAISSALAQPQAPKTIELQVTIESKSGTCISIAYKGEPNRLVDTLMSEAERCLPAPHEAKTDVHLKKHHGYGKTEK